MIKTNRIPFIQFLSLRLALFPLDIKIWMVTAAIWIASIGTVFSIFNVFNVMVWRTLEWEKFLTILLLPATLSGLAIAGYRWAISTSKPDVRSQLASQYEDLRLARQTRRELKRLAASARKSGSTASLSIPRQLREAFESNDTTPEMQERIETYVGAFASELADNLMKAKGEVLSGMVNRSADEFSRHGSAYADPRKAFDAFIHAYLAAPEHAERAAPRFFRDFDGFLKTELPELHNTFCETAELYRDYAEFVLSKANAPERGQAAAPQRKPRRMPSSLLGFENARIAS